MVNTLDPPARRVSRLEGIKENSHFLREPIATELENDSDHFSKDGVQILKFHGSYQQFNRDQRGKSYSFMLRTRNPGGFIPAVLYKALDRLTDDYGSGNLRATTRQGFQIHGILKQNLKTVLSEIVRNMGSTLGACGDLNRNVMAPSAPYKNRPDYVYAWEYADKLADLLTPQTGAYYEIWLDGEKVISAEEDPEVKEARQRNSHGTVFTNVEEPIYGEHYMPRKFKICITVPGDNSVDIYTQDVGFVVITNDAGELEGFNVLAGGGLGRTHNNEATFARKADEIGYVDKADVYDLLKAIVSTQRDYGDRFNRKHARMKYLINDWGVEKFRDQVARYLGKPLQPFRPLPDWKYEDYLGWHEQGDGKLFFGLSVENGRVKDEGAFQLKKALRIIIDRFELPMRLTPNHNVLLYEIDPAWQDEIESILGEHGVVFDPSQLNPLTRYSMACPALPTCSLALSESERVLPSMIDRIQALLDRMGLGDEHFVIRMTGCPNGCARPYIAELGLVGSGAEAYQVWLGACPNQTRLSKPYTQKMPAVELETFFEPLFAYFKQDRTKGESFGDFCDRVGFDQLRAFSESYELGSAMIASKSPRKNRRRVSLPDEVYADLKAHSNQEDRPMNQIVKDALLMYFKEKSATEAVVVETEALLNTEPTSVAETMSITEATPIAETTSAELI
ncbi:MAG: sulfite reductase, ferredoxin dependent [Cyanobacteria bacterium P01_H01_bin.15]